jgi:hypothetical protein
LGLSAVDRLSVSTADDSSLVNDIAHMSKYHLKPCGLPASDYLRSFWLENPTVLADHRTTPQLPSDVDVIIVGSGISGTLMAYNLLQKDPGLKILMLEAREVCSGATGRNGGQIKTDVSDVKRSRSS